MTANPTRYAALISIFLVGIALFRIVATYDQLSPTWDEPAHIARGMQWLDAGIYDYPGGHPPLAEVFTAAGPYLAGARYSGAPNRWQEGNRILFTGGDHHTLLQAARLGTLPFFLLLCLLVYLWSTKLAGPWAGVVSLFLATNTPLLLAHSGLATNDVATAALLLLGFYALIRYFERQTPLNALAFGAAGGLALATKFSALLYLPLGMAILTVFHAGAVRQGMAGRGTLALARDLSIALAAAFFTLWATYRFALAPLPPAALETFPLLSTFPGLGNWLSSTPLPLTGDYLRGIAELASHAERGHVQSFLGQIRTDGWWYFFPVLLLFTTPLSLLLLLPWGFSPAFDALQTRSRAAAPLVIAVATLLAVMPSSLNIGTRHVLIIVPLLSISFGVLIIRHCTRMPLKAAAAVMLAALFVESIRAHPDYLAYFNPLAGGKPEDIVVDSNLDWGQDLYRLDQALRDMHIEQAWIAYNGSVSPGAIVQGSRLHRLDPAQLCIRSPEGWAVISVEFLKVWPACARLARIPPARRVGSSLFLYRFAADGTPMSHLD